MSGRLENEIWSALSLARQEEHRMVSHFLLMAVVECRMKGDDHKLKDVVLQPASAGLYPAETVTEVRIS